MNKTDLLSKAQLSELRAALAAKYPQAQIVAMSARTGEGTGGWHRQLLDGGMDPREAPDVDYEVYAEGEALLGWLNAAAQVEAAEPFDGNALLQGIGDDVHARLARAGAEVAHLKMTLSPDEGNDLAVLNLVRGDGQPESIHRLQDEMESGELLVNLRAEADPELLRQVVLSVLAGLAPAVNVTIEHTEAFRPGKPQPTYRMATL